MPKLVAYLVVLVLTCGVAVVAVDQLADQTTLVTGQADRFSADEAQSGPLRVPLTVQAVERGVGRAVQLTGPGRVAAGGQPRVRSSSSVRGARAVDFGPGPFTVTLVPAAGRLEMDSVLQGPLQAS